MRDRSVRTREPIGQQLLLRQFPVDPSTAAEPEVHLAGLDELEDPRGDGVADAHGDALVTRRQAGNRARQQSAAIDGRRPR